MICFYSLNGFSDLFYYYPTWLLTRTKELRWHTGGDTWCLRGCEPSLPQVKGHGPQSTMDRNDLGPRFADLTTDTWLLGYTHRGTGLGFRTAAGDGAAHRRRSPARARLKGLDQELGDSKEGPWEELTAGSGRLEAGGDGSS